MTIVLVTPPSTPGARGSAAEVAVVQRMLAVGLPRLHLRKPAATREEIASYVDLITERYRHRVVLHDHHDLVEEFGLGGLHYRERLVPDGIIPEAPGKSVSVGYHRPQQLLDDKGKVDYCLLSPIYDSISKPGYCPPPELSDRWALRGYLEKAKYKVVALGGVTPDRFQDLADLGFQGAALLGAVWDAKDSVKALEKALEQAHRVGWNMEEILCAAP